MKKFEELFGMKTKAQAKSHCESQMAVSWKDLLELIQNSDTLSFVHNPRYFETHQNQPFQITERNYEELNDPQKIGRFLQKGINAFQANASKHVTAHFFDGENGEWHCFYWVGADIQGAEGGKVWGNVPHIHYTSHLFNITREQCEERITSEGVEGIDKAHLKLQN